LDERAGDQVGFDLFLYERRHAGPLAMIPIAMIYKTLEDAAAEITDLEKRGYPISCVEMGEEPDRRRCICSLPRRRIVWTQN
jgi:hypothetical protein